jgi:hypothetical protein
VVIGDGTRGKSTAPSRKPPAQPQLRIVAVEKEGLIEQADVVQHSAGVERRGAAWKKGSGAVVVLPLIFLQPASATVESVRVEKVPRGIDPIGLRKQEHLRRDHADGDVSPPRP